MAISWKLFAKKPAGWHVDGAGRPSCVKWDYAMNHTIDEAHRAHRDTFR